MGMFNEIRNHKIRFVKTNIINLAFVALVSKVLTIGVLFVGTSYVLLNTVYKL